MLNDNENKILYKDIKNLKELLLIIKYQGGIINLEKDKIKSINFFIEYDKLLEEIKINLDNNIFFECDNIKVYSFLSEQYIINFKNDIDNIIIFLKKYKKYFDKEYQNKNANLQEYFKNMKYLTDFYLKNNINNCIELWKDIKNIYGNIELINNQIKELLEIRINNDKKELVEIASNISTNKKRKITCLSKP